MTQTNCFRTLVRGVVKRRAAFLKSNGALIYPSAGTLWNASSIESARFDAFFVFFVAEIEFYFEGIIEISLKIFEDAHIGYFLKQCKAFEDAIKKIKQKKEELSKNHNANWNKIGFFFEFIGMKETTHFPQDLWADIQTLVSHRGELAHKTMTLRLVTDPRRMVQLIELTVKRLKQFDQKFYAWVNDVSVPIELLKADDFRFRPSFV